MADATQIAALALVRQLEPALQKHDRAQQNRIIRRLIEIRAPMAEQWQALAHLVLGNGEIGLARQAIELFVQARPGDPLAQYQKATVLERAGAMREAYALVRSLPANVPDPAAHAFSLGTAALFLGETQEAREQLELATRLRPQAGLAWLSLALSADLTHDAALGDRILTAEPDLETALPAERAAYFYSQGRVHAAGGDPALAFVAYARGAREVQPVIIYDREHDRADAQEALSGYDAASVERIARQQTEPTDRTIFVIGLPRTGTTLVEQILTSHSAVSDGGEVDRLSLLMHEIGGKSFSAVETFAKTRGVDEAARLWRHLVHERFPRPGRVVDKSLNTSRLLGLAAALLPDASLIWLTRDPLDCAWSCFSNFFYGSLTWSYDLEDIACHFRLEDELLRQWREILGNRLLVVPYEELVTQPAPWIRRILAHCRLDEEPQVFTPHQSDRTVTTASVMQVRRPINRSAIGAAEPYRQFMEPFLSRYYG